MQQICKHCSQNFEITGDDLKFYESVSLVFNDKRYLIPAPTFCPDCRQIRRLVWRNERNLYRRTCNLCQKKVLSIYRKENPFPVYCIKCWWSDKWDPLKYGMDFDLNKSFFQQFKKLQDTVPRVAVLQSQNENSEYTNHVSHLKDCYLLFSSDFNRDCYYGVWIENCQNCVDNLIINKCQLTHNAIFSDNIFSSTYVVHCSQCSDSAFLLDCRNCSHCFMCYALRNKKYCIENEQYSREEYFERIKKAPISSYANYEKFKKNFLALIRKAPYLYMWRNGRVFDSTGDFLTDVKNCKECYEIMEGWDCKYVQGAYQIKDAYDCCYVHGELGYENCECFPMPMKSAFNVNSYGGHSLQYCDLCMNNCADCFGCVSLKKQSNCILNKKYSSEKYEELAAKIIEHMQKVPFGGTCPEWGEFFPTEMSPFAYNETNAQDFFPLKKENVLAKGYGWKDDEKRDFEIQTYEIPDDIVDAPESVVNEILVCESCKRNFKIIFPEYELLKKLQLPLPRKCFECRHIDRSFFRKKRKLHVRKCHGCQAEIQTTYSSSSEAGERIFCEKCYMKAVY